MNCASLSVFTEIEMLDYNLTIHSTKDKVSPFNICGVNTLRVIEVTYPTPSCVIRVEGIKMRTTDVQYDVKLITVTIHDLNCDLVPTFEMYCRVQPN